MMDISVHNYEAYYLDYCEKRLDGASIAQLMLFLEQHPQLKAKLEGYKHIAVEPPAIKFKDKDSLKKTNMPVTPDNFDEIAAQWVDETLSSEMQNALQAFVRLTPGYARELELYGKTKVSADLSITYENKDELKRSPRTANSAIFYYLAAASIALLIGFYWLLKSSRKAAEVAIHNKIGTRVADTLHKSIAPVPPILPLRQTNTQDVLLVHNRQKKRVPSKQVVVPHGAELQKEILPLPKPESAILVRQESEKELQRLQDTSQRRVVINKATAKGSGDTSLKVAANSHPDIQWVKNSNSGKHANQVRHVAFKPFRSIGRLFRHGVSVRKLYNEQSGKLIAYRVQIGTVSHNFIVKNAY